MEGSEYCYEISIGKRSEAVTVSNAVTSWFSEGSLWVRRVHV